MALFKYDSTNDKLVPLTSEGSIGLPVGAVIAFAQGTSSNENWLLCDGRDTTGTAEELQTKYPALYTYLGNSNILPAQFDHSKLSEWKAITLPTTASNAITMDYDGFIYADAYVDGNQLGAWVTLHVNSNVFRNRIDTSAYNTNAPSVTVPIKKGDVVYLEGTRVAKQRVAYYKQPLYIKATSAGIEVDKDLYATKGYIRDQNILSDYESISWTNSEAGAFEMQYDGVFCSGNGSAEGVNFMISSDGGTSWTRVVGCGGGGEPGTWQASGAQILLQKGWKVYAVLNTYSAQGGLPESGSVAYYKLRDYTGR